LNDQRIGSDRRSVRHQRMLNCLVENVSCWHSKALGAISNSR
jgi:hypothetical protein